VGSRRAKKFRVWRPHRHGPQIVKLHFDPHRQIWTVDTIGAMEPAKVRGPPCRLLGADPGTRCKAQSAALTLSMRGAQIPRFSHRRPYRTTQRTWPDNWIYIHDPKVKVGRVQNFRPGPEMIPDETSTCLGLEYFCARTMISGP